MSDVRRLILVGAGHAHIEVLRQAARERFQAEIIVVSPSDQQLYSGLMPARLRGVVDDSALSIDVPALCRAAGATFVGGTATRLIADQFETAGESNREDVVSTNDEPDRVGVVVNGDTIQGTHMSLDIGSVPTGGELPGVREFAFGTRPHAAWQALLERCDALVRDSSPNAEISCVVVGGGAAGTELALALAARLRAASRIPHVTLVCAAPTILSGFSQRVVSHAERILAQHDIHTIRNSVVTEVTSSHVAIASASNAPVKHTPSHGHHRGSPGSNGPDSMLPSQLTVWATGAAAPPLVAQSTLPTDAHGFLSVDNMLRAANGASVWGAGDCVSLAEAPWMTKSGVYAVRAAPILAHNLRTACDGGVAKRFTPQRHTMFILDSADGRALLSWRSIALHTAWALRLKHDIDNRFVRRYQFPR